MDDKNKEVIFKEELEALVDSFGLKNQDGCKMAIRTCQDIFSMVSYSHQKQIADAFSLDEKVVKTIIKFIPSIKESLVEYEIVCCSGPRCAKNGSLEVIKAVKSSLGLDFNQVSPNGKIRLSTQNCFKKCHLGPNLMINGKFYHHMDKDKAVKLIKDII